MGYYEDGPIETIEQNHEAGEPQPAHPVGARLSAFRERIVGALAGLDRGRIDQLSLDSGAHLDEVHDVVGEVSGAEEDLGVRARAAQATGVRARAAQDTEYAPALELDSEAALDPDPAPALQNEPELEPESEDAEPSPFPVGRQGYNRAAVDARIAVLEAELDELRAIPAQPSITEEIERLGEQTASILVVAHDQAHETTRLAQEQADRCLADAASNAVAITEKAKRELRELDEETDTVWRERTRLLEDARNVGSALIALSDAAAARFPAEAKPAEPSASAAPPPVAGT